MFGYVRPRKDELKLRDYERYQAAYCGLCRALKRRCGFLSRFLVNYDMTFLYLLRSGLAPAAEVQPRYCPARVVGRRRCVLDEAGYAPVVDCNVIVCWHKLDDNVRDRGFFRGLPQRLLRLLFRPVYRRAVRRRPAFDALAREKLSELSRLEAGCCDSIDRTADCFAGLIAGCADELPDESVRRPMQLVLYHVGRFVYLADALDDLAEDCRTDSYNPLRYRFQPENGALAAEDLQYLGQLVDASVNIAGAALELLELRSNRALLENIIYLGLPAVFAAVKNGSFRSGLHAANRKETTR